MILASSLRRASGEPHSATALNRLVEALFLPWSVSMSSDAPYWRPPTPLGQYVVQQETYGLQARFRILAVGRQFARGDSCAGVSPNRDLSPTYWSVPPRSVRFR